MGQVLESTKFVADHATMVSIDSERAAEYANEFEHGTTKHWLSAAPFDFSGFTDEEKLNFLLLFNALSFSYWGEPKWTIEYDGKSYDGSWGMIVALGRAVRTGIQLFNASFCSAISREDFASILIGTVEIPLFEERLRIMREIGFVAESTVFVELVNSANGEALVLLDLILKKFPSFSDESVYQGRTVFFEKRAQLLVADIYHLFGGTGYGALRNTAQLTACADYKLPQILRKLGILRYAEDLAAKVDAKIELTHGPSEEVEIRACTIQAVELIKNEVCKRVPTMTSSAINDHLWLMTQEKFPDDKPYHRTRTTAY